MDVKRHKHIFTALGCTFGPYGRQDVHYHVCFTEGCSRVLVGECRACDGRPESHHREAL